MGSKTRIVKHILPIMLQEADKLGLTTWVEPFVGGGNMIDKVPDTYDRAGWDINPHTIAALRAIRDHIDILPDSLTEEEYKAIKGSTLVDPVNSWLRFVASFGGKFDNGYAREKGSDASTFVQYGKRNAYKQTEGLQGVDLYVGSYDCFTELLEGCLIYCDPPYQGTTSYKTDTFNHPEFWEWCRYMSTKNKVFISEYQAPVDFKCVWEGSLVTNFASTRIKANQAVEKLFTI